MATGTKSKRKKAKKRKYTSSILSNIRKPSEMTVAKWQTILRKQIAEKSDFKITNIGGGLAYSDYHMFNANTKNTYKVALSSTDNS